MNNRRVFWFHYRKSDGRMTIHWKQRCIVVDNVRCSVVCTTKRNNKQPKLVMKGYAKYVHICTDYKGIKTGVITDRCLRSKAT